MKKYLLIICLLFSYLLHAQTVNPADPLVVCEQNTDGVATFDLTVVIPQILGSQNPADYGVTFYETQTNAQNEVQEIINTTAFSAISFQTVYVRVEELATGNFAVGALDLIVGEIPEANFYGGITVCDDTTLDGFTSFDLTQSETAILGSQNPADFTLAYYASMADAQNENPIPDPTNFTNSSSPQTVYVQVSKNVSACFATNSFPIKVVDCSTDADNDLVATGDEDVNLDGNLMNDDTDADTFWNFEDNDDDGDGILTADEDYNNNGDPLDDDTNSNGIPDFLDENVTLSNSSFLINKFTIYPNPSTEKVTLQFGKRIQLKEVTVLDLTGKTVLEFFPEKTKKELTLDLSSLSSGVYLLSANTSEGKITEKIVVQ